VIEVRLVKVVMVFCLALFALVVTYDNVVDHGSNYAFVQHVLSMDTTFPDNALMGRRIVSPAVWSAAYWGIILAEGLTALMLGGGAIAMLRTVRADAVRFRQAKRFVYLGAGLGFLLWFFGFMVVGGEWFASWQSEIWNGQEAAFRFYMPILAVLVFVNQRDD
jgi:predicted small integral membrane protein